MPCLIALLHTLFPMLFASGKAVSALKLNFDRNSNIVSPRRYGAKNATTGALLDDLTMTYEGNQLRYITDDATDYPYEASLDFRAKAPIESTPGASVATPFGLIGGFNPIDTTVVKPNPNPGINPVSPTYSADYAYDANGNMTQDRHSSITSIAYNVLNLPQTVTYEGTVANRSVSQMVYDASGRKHIVRNGATVLSKFRGDETRYIGDYIMVNDTIDRLQTPYGYLRDGIFHSYVFDYQGNVMAVVTGNDVTQTNLYYADGLPMNTSTNPTANAFKYTAKELSLFRGLPVYDYTARHTLPQINRFRTMDPLSEKYHGISPYAFCAGDPVNRIDPTGLKDIEVDQKGEIIKNESSPSDTFDSVTVVDDKGSVVASTNIQLNSVNVIPPSESSTVKVTEYQITGVENATKVFEVLSQSEVEYGICITSPLESESTDEISTTNSTVNFITTTHQTDGESKMSGYIKSELSNKYKILEYNHSHPSNTPYPSNFKNSNGNYVGDIPVYRSLINTLGYDIKCNIFLPGTQTYVNFNPFDKKYDKK